MKELNQDDAAKADIVARPEVTAFEPDKALVKAPEKVNEAHSDVAPDGVEKAAGKVISKTFDDLKTVFGVETDKDFSALLSETLGGIFGALRAMSGKSWIKYAVAGSALLFSFVPVAIKFSMKKKDSEKNAD